MAIGEQLRLRTTLEYAQKQVVDGERIIEKQLQVISEMEARGVSATASRMLLESLRRTQVIFLDELHRAEQELAAFEYDKRFRPLVSSP